MRLIHGRFLATLSLGLASWCSAAEPSLDEAQPATGLSLQWIRELRVDALAPHAAPLVGASPATSWAQLLEEARRHAPSNRAATAGLLAAQAQEKQAWISAWLPRVNAFANSAVQRQTYNGQITRTPSSSLALSATWPLWRAAERAQAEAQQAQTTQSVWQEKLNQQRVALAVSTAYLDGVEAVHLRRIVQAQQDVLQEQRHINERRIQGGAGTVLDLLETRTRIEQAQATLQTLDTRIHNQGLLIQRLTDMVVAWPADLGMPLVTASASMPLAIPSLDDALQQLHQMNPQTQEAVAQARAAQATVRSRRAEQWQPGLDLVGQVSRSQQTARFDGQSETQRVASQSVGVELSWPLFTSGQQQQRVKESAALLSQAQAQLDDTQSQAETDLRTAYAALNEAQQRIQIQTQLAQTAQAGLDAIRKAFLAGIRNNLDVLNAQTQVGDAQQNLVTATISALNAQVNILALLGQLDAGTIAPLTIALAPSAADHTNP